MWLPIRCAAYGRKKILVTRLCSQANGWYEQQNSNALSWHERHFTQLPQRRWRTKLVNPHHTIFTPRQSQHLNRRQPGQHFPQTNGLSLSNALCSTGPSQRLPTKSKSNAAPQSRGSLASLGDLRKNTLCNCSFETQRHQQVFSTDTPIACICITPQKATAIAPRPFNATTFTKIS